jgi:type I restriction enzyme, S subunit
MNFEPRDAEAYRLEPNDILLNEGQSLELIGRPAMYRGELPGACFTNTLVRFRAGPSALPEFALLVFRSWMHGGIFRRIARITTNIAHLGAGRFAELMFPVPPRTDQRKIVDICGELLGTANVSILDIDRQFVAASQLRQSILAVAFSGKLAPQDPNDEPASELLVRLHDGKAAAELPATISRRCRKDVDGRVKPGHDDRGRSAADPPRAMTRKAAP